MPIGADYAHRENMDTETVTSSADKKEGVLLGILHIVILLVVLAFFSVFILPILAIVIPYVYASMMCNRTVRPIICPITFEEAESLKIVIFFFYVFLSASLFAIGLALSRIGKGIVKTQYKTRPFLLTYFDQTTITGLATFFVLFFLFFCFIKIF